VPKQERAVKAGTEGLEQREDNTHGLTST